jgi:hypothetical protein
MEVWQDVDYVYYGRRANDPSLDDEGLYALDNLNVGVVVYRGDLNEGQTARTDHYCMEVVEEGAEPLNGWVGWAARSARTQDQDLFLVSLDLAAHCPSWRFTQMSSGHSSNGHGQRSSAAASYRLEENTEA